MAIRMVESSANTKPKTIKKLKDMKKLKGRKLQWVMYRYWMKVYFYALEECPEDTGALKRTIRITRDAKTESKSDAKGTSGTGISMGTEGDTRWDYVITAGGQGVVNPKHNREVDYASAVHDGYYSIYTARYVMGNPFLMRAIQRGEADFKSSINEYIKWFEDEWKEGNLHSAPWKTYNLNTKIVGEP